MVRLVKLTPFFFRNCGEDPELLSKEGRPCVLLLRLRYRGRRLSFAVPLRSNLTSSTPESLYFPLPPNPRTRSGNRHGLHFEKMFPVNGECYQAFRFKSNDYLASLVKYIDRRYDAIVARAQGYLDDYIEKGPFRYSEMARKLDARN